MNSPHRYRWYLLFIFLSGLAILIIPEQGDPVFQLNEAHGPSMLDLTGLFLIFLSWVLSTAVVIRNWRLLIKRSGAPTLFIMLAVYILSITGIIIALHISVEWLLWISITISVCINFSIVISAFKIYK